MVNQCHIYEIQSKYSVLHIASTLYTPWYYICPICKKKLGNFILDTKTDAFEKCDSVSASDKKI